MTSEVVVIVAVSAGVIAGLISGICYVLVAQGIQIKRKCSKPHTQWFCSICEEFSVEGVCCTRCKLKVCKGKCSLPTDDDIACTSWICKVCWYKDMLEATPSNFKKLKMSGVAKMPNETLALLGDCSSHQIKETEQVREFIEKIVASLLGGNVDNVSVLKLYDGEFYEGIVKKYHPKLSTNVTDLGTALYTLIANLPTTGQSPCTAHAALKKTIQDLLREATGLPILQKAQDRSILNTSTEGDREQTYEDLLATAVINKVITHYQNNNNNNTLVKGTASQQGSINEEKEYFFGETTLEDKWGLGDNASLSSIEDWLQCGKTKYVNKHTLTIENLSENEFDPHSSSNSDDDESDDQNENIDDQNWLLQKPAQNNNNRFSPVPVAMLVPSPDVNAKVLIGDEDVEEMSDLSDVESEIASTSPTSLTRALIQNKAVIGGGGDKSNDLIVTATPYYITSGDEQDEEEDEQSVDSGVKLVKQYESAEPICNDLQDYEDTSLVSTYSGVQEKDVEYTEKFGTVPRIAKSTTQEGEERFGKDYYARQASSPSGGKLGESNRPNIAEQFQQRLLSQNEEVEEENDAANIEVDVSVQIIHETVPSDQTSDSDVSSRDYYDLQHSKSYNISQHHETDQPDKAALGPTVIKIKEHHSQLPPPSTSSRILRPGVKIEQQHNSDSEKLEEHEQKSLPKKFVAHQPIMRPKLLNTGDRPKTMYASVSQPVSVDNEMLLTIPVVAAFRTTPKLKRSTSMKIYQNTNETTSPKATAAPVNRKLDSTLFRKIYQDLEARKLTFREQPPSNTPAVQKTANFEEENHPRKEEIKVHKIAPLMRNLNDDNKHTQTSVCTGKQATTIDYDDNDGDYSSMIASESDRSLEIEEIESLKRQKLVANCLNQMRKSHPRNLTNEIVLNHHTNEVNTGAQEDGDEEIQLPVKDLKKKFENKDAQAKVATHSLTARTISKNFGTGQHFLNELKLPEARLRRNEETYATHQDLRY